jgi:Baseplate J-like protein
MLYFCCDQRRRDLVLAPGSNLNGIDYLEVLDSDAPTPSDRQVLLQIHLLKPLDPLTLSSLKKENLQIEGGDRIRNIQVVDLTFLTSPPNTLQIRVKQWGDFSTYTLKFVLSSEDDAPPDWIDPVLSAINFSFKVECPSDFDCRNERVCPPEPQTQLDVNYLAKDFSSFRQLMLDRMSVVMPQWQERNLADLGMVLTELMAYVYDYLSYQQDAVLTEFSLGTARLRNSVRRHVRLVDYFMHDGCNARVWVQVQVNAESVTLNKEEGKTRTRFLTRCLNETPINNEQLQQVLNTYHPEVFELIQENITLYKAHNTILFYTWGDDRCCLPKGATRATLKGSYPNLKVGDVLILEEVLGAKTGKPEDADPNHRHAVRLNKVSSGTDRLVLQPPDNNPLDITEIAWATEDALPFSFCLDEVEDESNPEQKNPTSIVLGNIVLADHGYTIESEESLGAVPDVKLLRVPVASGDRCQPITPKAVQPRFNPRLQKAPLTQTARVKKIDPITKQQKLVVFDLEASATSAFQWQMRQAYPAIILRDNKGVTWLPQRDLLSSRSSDTHFVAEVEGDGFATLRFAEGLTSGTAFTATYRIGNGKQGNIGSDKLFHIVGATTTAIEKIRNPLPARGGIEPESIEEVRQRAPSAFRTQERAVTPEDYAAVAERYPGVQRAAATFRWTGSWRTVFVTIDRVGGLKVDEDFENKMRLHLERFRMAGHDLEVDAPRYVPLEIEMQVCVKRDYFHSQVKKALLEIFSDLILPDGRRGVFHPDNFTFGQPVYLSPLYGAAQAVDGVASVQVSTFQRQGQPRTAALELGKLELGRLEIAQLGNNPNFPDRGVFRLTMEGGK